MKKLIGYVAVYMICAVFVQRMTGMNISLFFNLQSYLVNTGSITIQMLIGIARSIPFIGIVILVSSEYGDALSKFRCYYSIRSSRMHTIPRRIIHKAVLTSAAEFACAGIAIGILGKSFIGYEILNDILGGIAVGLTALAVIDFFGNAESIPILIGFILTMFAAASAVPETIVGGLLFNDSLVLVTVIRLLIIVSVLYLTR